MQGKFVRKLSALGRFFHPRFDPRTLEVPGAGLRGSVDPEEVWLSLLRHELKTPLAGLLGLAYQLERAGLTPGQRRLLAALTDSGRQLSGMIDRLVVQPAAGARPLPCGDDEIDGHAFLERLLLAHWPQAAERKIGLHLLADALLPRRWVTDACCLRQILDNLLANAIHATLKGHVLLRAAPASRPIRGRFAVELAVEDTGGGLDPSLRGRLFGWGERGPVELSRRPAGSGIGLFVCRWLSEELGGWITHGDGPTGGAVFTLGVPVARDSQPLPACRIRRPVLDGFRCIVTLAPPLDAVAASVLERIGISTTQAKEPDWDCVPRGFEAVLCERRQADGLRVRLPGRADCQLPLFVTRAAGSGSNDGMLQARPLALPLLRSGIESLLLEIALESRIAAAREGTGCFNDAPGSAPQLPR
jgi:hypothetical protein